MASYQFEASDNYHEFVIDDAKNIGALIGFDISEIYFSGFWSQGDGACFIGSVGYATGCAGAVLAYAPTDAELQRIAADWQSIQRRNFYRLSATVTHRGRYNHELSVAFDWSFAGADITDRQQADCEQLESLARDFMRWTYRALQREYEYSSAWQAATHWQQLADDAAIERAAARQLVKDMRDARNSGAIAAPSICQALRASIRRHIASAADSLATRRDIERDFAYWTNDRRRLDVAEFAAINC